MVESTLRYTRTAEERADQRLSWVRSDEAFFASGACHILAFTVAGELARPDGEIVAIVPTRSKHGFHVYYRLGIQAFDFNGWNLESELLEQTRLDYLIEYQGWEFESVVVDLAQEEFCTQFESRLPRDFFASPIPRARTYAHAIGVCDLDALRR